MCDVRMCIYVRCIDCDKVIGVWNAKYGFGGSGVGVYTRHNIYTLKSSPVATQLNNLASSVPIPMPTTTGATAIIRPSLVAPTYLSHISASMSQEWGASMQPFTQKYQLDRLIAKVYMYAYTWTHARFCCCGISHMIACLSLDNRGL